MPKAEKSQADLFGSLQAAYADVQEKQAARDAAAAKLSEADQYLSAAKSTLSALQKDLNDILGLAVGDRVRMSA